MLSICFLFKNVSFAIVETIKAWNGLAILVETTFMRSPFRESDKMCLCGMLGIQDTLCVYDIRNPKWFKSDEIHLCASDLNGYTVQCRLNTVLSVTVTWVVYIFRQELFAVPFIFIVMISTKRVQLRCFNKPTLHLSSPTTQCSMVTTKQNNRIQ